MSKCRDNITAWADEEASRVLVAMDPGFSDFSATLYYRMTVDEAGNIKAKILDPAEIFIAWEPDPMLARQLRELAPGQRPSKSQRRQIRAELARRDGAICYWCKTGMRFVKEDGSHRHPDFPTVEHIIPIAEGGTNAWDNLALAHKRCNQRRDHQRLREAAAAS